MTNAAMKRWNDDLLDRDEQLAVATLLVERRAKRVAEANNEDETHGWSYKAEQVPGSVLWVVGTYDEDGLFLGYL